MDNMQNVTEIMDKEYVEQAAAMLIDMMVQLKEQSKLKTVSYINLDSTFKQEEQGCFKVDGAVIVILTRKNGFVHIDVFTTVVYGSETFNFKLNEKSPYAIKIMHLVRKYARDMPLNKFKRTITSILEAVK